MQMHLKHQRRDGGKMCRCRTRLVMGVASGYVKARTCMVAERCVVGQNMVVERCVVVIQGGDVASDGRGEWLH